MKPELTKQLRRDEGVIASAYQDSLGFLTIGVGRLIDARKGGHLSDTEIDFLLSNDIDEKTAQVKAHLPWISKLSEPRQGALINCAFNLGINGLLGFQKTLKLIEDGQYKEAAEEILRSKWASQVGDRARRLARQIETGEWV